MASNKAPSENILNSNNFQTFLDSLMASDNSGLSTFLANQVNDDIGDVCAGANPKGKKGKKKAMKRVKGEIKTKNKNVIYVPAIHSGGSNLGVVVGSTDPTESSAYKNMLKNDLLREVDETFARMLLENKIPIVNSGKVLDYIEIVNDAEIESGTNNDDFNLENGAKNKPKPTRTKPKTKHSHMPDQYNTTEHAKSQNKSRLLKTNESVDTSLSNGSSINNEITTEIDNGAKPKKKQETRKPY
jgi:hypothetical protein